MEDAAPELDAMAVGMGRAGAETAKEPEDAAEDDADSERSEGLVRPDVSSRAGRRGARARSRRQQPQRPAERPGRQLRPPLTLRSEEMPASRPRV